MISLSLELWGLESKVSAFVEDVQEQMRSEVAAVQSDELSLESETFLRQYVAMNQPVLPLGCLRHSELRLSWIRFWRQACKYRGRNNCHSCFGGSLL